MGTPTSTVTSSQTKTLEENVLGDPLKKVTTEQKRKVLLSEPMPVTPGMEANFTWADLQRLGGRLVLSDDSSWVPSLFGDNVLRTIKYVLDPKNAIEGDPLSMGINLRDLYHGHIVMPIGKIPQDVLDRRNAFKAKYDAAIDQAFPDMLGEPSVAQRREIRQADTETMGDFRSLIEFIVKRLPRAGIIYHTYEFTKPSGMKSNDPRRQILMPFSGTNPTIGVNFWGDYSTVLQFSFLVSPYGKLFIRGPDNNSIKGLEFRG
ncbi:MAG: hypothetical protein GY788_23110 [bacterium]|nr:hypothetical protein [bacterium]